MTEMFEFARLVVICFTLVLIAGGVLLAMPESRFREFCLPIVAWIFAFLCLVYVISPFDGLPEGAVGPVGLIDDALVLVAGIASAASAMKAGKERRNAQP